MCSLKVTSNKHKLTSAAGPPGASGKAGQPPNTRGGGKKSLKQTGVENNLVCLTSEQLQQILNTVHAPINTPINALNEPEEQAARGINVLSNTTCSRQGTDKYRLYILSVC